MTVAPYVGAWIEYHDGTIMDLLTTAEASEILGVTQRRVQALIKSGRLPAEKIGRDWMIKREDVEAHRKGKGGRPSKAPGQ